MAHEVDGNIAANLRAIREAAGISQEALAAQLTERDFGWSQTTVWKVESGQRPLRAAELVALTEVLDVPVDALVEPPEQSAAQRELARDYAVLATAEAEIRRLTREVAEIEAKYPGIAEHGLDVKLTHEQSREGTTS